MNFAAAGRFWVQQVCHRLKVRYRITGSAPPTYTFYRESRLLEVLEVEARGYQ